MQNKNSVHQKCIDFFLIVAYKYLNGLTPVIMNNIFKLRQNIYNLRNFQAFEPQNPEWKFYLDSIVYRASQLWKNVPEEILNWAIFNLQRTDKNVPLISCSYLLDTSRPLYLVYLNLVEYVLVPHVHRILEHT